MLSTSPNNSSLDINQPAFTIAQKLCSISSFSLRYLKKALELRIILNILNVYISNTYVTQIYIV